MTALRSDLQKGQTLIDYFYYWEKQRPNAVYLRQPVGSRYQDFTWGEVGRQARIVATYLNSLDLPPKSNIGLLARNCAHWIITDLAIMLSGHVSVPLYPTLNAQQLRNVLTHSGCSLLFVGKVDNWTASQSGIPAHTHCVILTGQLPDLNGSRWETILEQYSPMTHCPLPHPSDLFTIIYTSGTTGNPKGVMMDYKAMASAIDATRPMMRHDIRNPRFFSYLPLSHVAERSLVEATSMIAGGTVYFSESADRFRTNLASARPTHFLAVPHIWSKIQQQILAELPQQKLNWLLRTPLLSALVKQNIKRALGLDQAKLILTGAAPMPLSLIQWFRRLGIFIQEAYGLTETLGATTLMPPDELKDGTVGQLHKGVQARIDALSGEIQIKCDWTLRGYYREPALTQTVLDADGWLHTGDTGDLDAEGFLKVTGRLKDIYKTTKGKYIVPAPIEHGFAENHFVEQICVAGQQLPQPIALIVLSDQGRQADKTAVTQSLAETIDALNRNLDTYERVKKVVIVKDHWTTDNNLVTPTLKIRRTSIESRYQPQLQPWYEDAGTVIWEG